jgi:hypothetical protein
MTEHVIPSREACPERSRRDGEESPAYSRRGFLMNSPLIRPSGTFSPQAGRRTTVAPRPAQRGEGGRRPGEGLS